MKVAEILESLLDGNSVACNIAGGADAQGCGREELLRLYRQTLLRVKDKDVITTACGILPRMGYGKEWMCMGTGLNCRSETSYRGPSILMF